MKNRTSKCRRRVVTEHGFALELNVAFNDGNGPCNGKTCMHAIEECEKIQLSKLLFTPQNPEESLTTRDYLANTGNRLVPTT